VIVPLGYLRQGRPRPSIREWPPLPPTEAPLVSVIVPARNEERMIERCVRSVLASEYPNLEIVAVDDRSTDRTGQILRELAAHDGRLRVVSGAELPPGWYGKPWACWQGYRVARGSVLLFTDADTIHGPALHGHAVAMLVAERADLVSVMCRQEMLSFWERAVQPFFFLIIGMRFGSLERINKTTNPRDAIANGQFILMTRESYEAVGGHERVKDTVVEDLGLAAAYLRAGRRLRFAAAERDMTTRMYTSLDQIVEGWTKNFFVAVRMTMGSTALAYLGMLAMLAVPLLLLAPAVALLLGLLRDSASLVTFGVIGSTSAAAVHALFLAFNGANPAWALTFPIGALAQAVILMRAAARGTRRIEWKGRTYSHRRP
jgi:chlorobactene glucosyltransferase